MTTRRRAANPFARVLAASTLTGPRPAAAATTQTSPSPDPPPNVEPAQLPTALPPTSVDTSAASLRWRNYAPSAVPAAPPASIPAAATDPTPSGGAPAPGRHFGASRRFGPRPTLVGETRRATAEASTDTARASQDVASDHGAQSLPIVVPTSEPAPLPLAAAPPAPETPAANATQSASLVKSPSPVQSTTSSPAVIPTTTSTATVPVPSDAGVPQALAMALAEVARQKALVARLVSVVAADCPGCCAKVIAALVDAPPTPTAYAAPGVALPLASATLPQQHNHFHLSIESRQQDSQATRLRRKALGVSRRAPSSMARSRLRPSV